MIRVSLQRLFQCKTRQDFDSLNFLSAFKFSRAGRPKIPYQKTKITNVEGYATYDDFIVKLWNFINADTANSKSLLLNMINDGVYDRYLRLFNKSLDEPGRKDQFLNLYKIYMDIKDTEFMRKMNRYRLLKILRNNGVLFKTRKLGNKPKPITKIRISGLFQVDVKVTHIGDLKYHEVGY